MKVLVNVKSLLTDFLFSNLPFLLKQMSEIQSPPFSSFVTVKNVELCPKLY